MHRPLRLHRLALLMTLVFALGCVFAAGAQARQVKVQGMRMNVPAGYQLTYRKGSYTLANRQRFVKLTFGRTPIGVRPTANQIAQGMKGRLSKVRAAKNGRSLSATITRTTGPRGKRVRTVYQLRLRRNGMQTNV